MPVLPSELRNRLESTVKAARWQAEAAARAALERLTVGTTEPGGHLSVGERQLRNRLRAHGRQLGDQRDTKAGTQSTNRLVHECAYEHWHRMLFARFLAENHLLIHEKEGMPVTLAECDELAADEGAPDGWTLAARYAARMLPQIFRPDDPVLQVGFAPEHKRGLEKLVTELPGAVFTADDSLGWVYQFWQSEYKDQVNASGDKITGETLPAVTQLFTEHYMVLFLLHNTIGAWWAARCRAEGRIPKAEWDQCQTEDDCRKLVSLPGLCWEYLRFVKNEAGEWSPAAGSFPGWPKALNLFKLLDPCCGSGHIIIAAFEILVRLRMQDEKLSAPDACDAVLRENLHGLELDQRCTQIAAFALALTAWKFTGGFRPLPSLNIACSGLGVNARKEDWLALANGDTRLRSGLEQLYDLFQKAPELGSLINPRRVAHGDLVTASFAEIQPLLIKALQSEKAKRSDDLNEIGVAAQGMTHAANLLSLQFSLAATNVPYLMRGKQNDFLQDFCQTHAPEAKSDLATVFLKRCLSLSTYQGSVALVTPQNWLFLGSYKRLRERLLKEAAWRWIVRLGVGAFETVSGHVVNAALVCLENKEPKGEDWFFELDVCQEQSVSAKAVNMRSGVLQCLAQSGQLKNPDARIGANVATDSASLLSAYAECYQGLVTGDLQRFTREYWEVPKCSDGWVPLRSSNEDGLAYSGISSILLWQNGKGQLADYARATREWLHDMHESGNRAWGKHGVALNRMSELSAALYLGEAFDNNVAVIVPKKHEYLAPIWHFCSSRIFAEAVRSIDRSIKITNQTLLKVHFDFGHWQKVAKEAGPLPKPATTDPTQWLCAGHPLDSTVPLQVGVARLLGYRWPRQAGQTISGAPPMPNDGLEKFVDEDGIVCVPSVRGEQPAADRLRELLIKAYGKTWSPAQQDELLAAVGFEGRTLEDWLRNGFFEQHCKFFHHRPFIWQVWDGRKDGFSALVNYHKLDHKLLEKLAYTYLGEWIKKQQDAVASEESGADDRLLKARQLQDRLKLFLEGEAPYDIFVRWKPLAQHSIGWHPDLNDGVRLNIRPFIEADVLRKRPNIKWGIDRGKNPPGSPWGEERDNDRHLSLAEKRGGREG
jgi:N-6 DNA Methylase